MTALDEETIQATLRNQIRHDVQKRVSARLRFVWHLAVFAITNVAMYAINRAYSPTSLWFVWPLCGWGMGLFMHGLGVFGSGHRQRWVEAEVERELARRGLRS